MVRPCTRSVFLFRLGNMATVWLCTKHILVTYFIVALLSFPDTLVCHWILGLLLDTAVRCEKGAVPFCQV